MLKIWFLNALNLLEGGKTRGGIKSARAISYLSIAQVWIIAIYGFRSEISCYGKSKKIISESVRSTLLKCDLSKYYAIFITIYYL